ncbi:MAG: polar growth protein [Candelina mexicana]|nr:MAG: polar growth protein [Candelina mexicana]
MALRYQSESPKKALPGQILLVVHDFEARSPDELTLAKGDRIELIERDDDFGDGWYLGKHMRHGMTGLFPEVYTTTAPKSVTAVAVTKASGPRGLTNSVPNGAQETSVQGANDLKAATSQFSVGDDPQLSKYASATGDFSMEPVTPPPLNTTPPQQHNSSATRSAHTPQVATTAQRNIGMSLNTQRTQGQDSPVMSETLSVIDEHITDMHSPRHSVVANEARTTNDSGSEYSSQLDHRLSYITGVETDEEEQSAHSKEEVMNWTPAQVSEYLSDIGVEKRHCDVFREQEISGEVLLGIDQSAIFMKELDLGLVGRRLRTWHKIKTLQEEVNGPKTRRNTAYYMTSDGSADDSRRNRGSTLGTVLPRIPSIVENPESKQQRLKLRQQAQEAQEAQRASATNSPSSSLSPTPESPRLTRPSAASVRELGHSRRHSSVDISDGPKVDSLKNRSSTSSPVHTLGTSHKKQPSFDRNWTMSAVTPGTAGRSSSSAGAHRYSGSADHAAFNSSPREATPNALTAIDLDRGYFSGGELEGRKTRNVLKKRDSVKYSRNSSLTDDLKKRDGNGQKCQSRVSADSTIFSSTSPASKRTSWKGRFRPASDAPKAITPPKETKSAASAGLEEEQQSTTEVVAPSPNPSSDVSSSGRGSPPPPLDTQKPVTTKSRIRSFTFRAISDAVTPSEKATVKSSSQQVPSPVKESPLQSPTRASSSTPSGASKSFECEPVDRSMNANNLTASALAPTSGTRRKSKKHTSAYTRGLERKTPQEQMILCDYSGWMKKKSSNLMTTWKSRLFVLRGCRLSYYYTEDDQEEKGLIDISSHRVLPADNDRITGIHATLTGATNSPTSPQNAQTTTAASTDAATMQSPSSSPQPGNDSFFIFKLVPPRAGLSRAVNFTKPTVHYFAVDNVRQGRLWMAALMKATIDLDETKGVTSTNQQKTISLAKAKALRHRPPVLMGLDEKIDSADIKTPHSDQTGLYHKSSISDMEDTEHNDSGVSGLEDRTKSLEVQVDPALTAGTNGSSKSEESKTDQELEDIR